MDSTILLARQAIYDTRLRIHAWELLFRAQASQEAAEFANGDQATSSVLLNAFSSLPVADILEGKPAFINFTRRLLDYVPPINPRQLVVEVLEDIRIDADTLAAIARLKQLGYTIALDDYVYIDCHQQLMGVADIVKIDVLANSQAEVAELVSHIRPFGVRLLAEKVETQAMFDACRETGFELFQGFFLARPQLVKGNALKSDQRSVLNLLATLRKPDVDFREIERVLLTDSVLVFKMLRLVNSALFNLQREITSIRQALALLGMNRVRSWAQLLALSNLENKPAGLYITAMVRARLGELLAQRSSHPLLSGDQQFTIGLLSTLDAFLGMELEEILASTGIVEELREAILHHRGESGFLLGTTIALERGEFDNLDWQRLGALGIDADGTRDDYIESLRWAQEALQFLR